MDKNFIVPVGGAGKSFACDRELDQTWTHYIVPIQLAAMRDLYKKEQNEQVYWVVYEPSYINSSLITHTEKKQDNGKWLHSIRKKAAEAVKAKGSANYIHRIKIIAIQNNITYKGIHQPKDFWNFLETFPYNSINRVWYVGHASPQGLFLGLVHDPNDSACLPIAAPNSVIYVNDIKAHKKLKNKLVVNTKKSSKFYGCFTSAFAKEWHQILSVPTEGPVYKIDFGVVDRPSPIQNVLERIQQADTSFGHPEWKTYAE